MKIRKGTIIAYDPYFCETIGDRTDDPHFAVGVVMGYDKWADTYDIDIGFENIFASITPNLITRDSLRIISEK